MKRIILSIIAPAAIVAAAPAAAEASEAPAAPIAIGTAATPGAEALAARREHRRTRAQIIRLANRSRTHARQLGLALPPIPTPSKRPDIAQRQERRLDTVVDFLAARDEVRRPVGRRTIPRSVPKRGTLRSRVRHHHRRAVRQAARLGLDRPSAPRSAHSREALIGELARWRSTARWLRARNENIRPSERPIAKRVPHYRALMCIARHESGGRWSISTGNGYYGGLQMDRRFQRTYGPRLYRAKGTADNWTRAEQMRVAARAVRTRGFHPWPNTARTCGLI